MSDQLGHGKVAVPESSQGRKRRRVSKKLRGRMTGRHTRDTIVITDTGAYHSMPTDVESTLHQDEHDTGSEADNEALDELITAEAQDWVQCESPDCGRWCIVTEPEHVFALSCDLGKWYCNVHCRARALAKEQVTLASSPVVAVHWSGARLTAVTCTHPSFRPTGSVEREQGYPATIVQP